MSILSLHRREDIAPTSKPGFRPDIEGLRALAVLLVVVNHLCGQPYGGFIGVDIFFVISGYLITGQLVREQARTGWVSLSSFYAKRLRRIIPAATLVIALTIAVSFVFWYLPRAGQAALDGAAALLWVSNWHFAGLGVDYLQTSGPVSPFQHYWSLSVEEQFYVFWPWLLLAMPALASRWKRVTTTTALVGGTLAFAIVSFIWALVATRMLPTFAYFDTVSRGWEFALGALVAILPATRIAQLGAWVRWVPAAGLATILAGALLITDANPFPGPWAIVPVLGTVMIIGGNKSTIGPGMFALTNPVSRYVGRISYSLYLWHFPVIVFTTVLVSEVSFVSVGIAVVLMTILSCLSFHFVEEPIRESGWLRSWERAGLPSRRGQLIAAVALALIVLILTAAQLRGPHFLREQSAAAAVVSDAPRLGAATVMQSEEELATAVSVAASKMIDADKVVPSLNVVGAGQQALAMDWAVGCRNDPGTPSPRICASGAADAHKSAIVIGDSIAMSWMPTITRALPENWKVTGLGFASCTPYDITTRPVVPSATFEADCATSKQRMIDLATQGRPDLIFISSHHYPLVSDSMEPGSWGEAVSRTLTVLATSGATIALLPKPPAGADIRNCASRVTGLAACSHSLDPQWATLTNEERLAVATAQSKGIPAHFLEIRSWFCTHDDVCPPAIGGYVVRTDVGHLSNAFAESLATVMSLQLSAAINGA